jgi:EpsI family protein
MKPIAAAMLLAGLMIAASVAASVLRPAPRDPNLPPSIVLEKSVPRQLGQWREVPQRALQIVNPQTQELLDKLYSQILSRTYVNEQGYSVMLSIAYGDDQRGGLQAHMPEVCYPAQGFKLESALPHILKTPFGQISGKRLLTRLGARSEPVTYWFAMGEKAVQGRWERRLVEIRLGLTGQVPDGLLVRISSIDPDPYRAFKMHEAFLEEFLNALPPNDRIKLAGL